MAFAQRNMEARRRSLEEHQEELHAAEALAEEQALLDEMHSSHCHPSSPVVSSVSGGSLRESSTNRTLAGEPPAKRARRSLKDIHFEAVKGGRRKCKYCATDFAEGSSTTSLSYHLKIDHPQRIREDQLQTKPPVPAAFKQPGVAGTDDAAAMPKWKSAKIDRQLQRFFTSTFAPFSYVDHAEFRAYSRLLNPRYQLPSRNTLKNQILSDFIACRKHVIKLLESTPGRISVTADFWTSISREGYLAVTAHWISSDWTLCKATLDFLYVQERHTATNIASRLMKIFKDFQITDKILALTTDHGGDIRSACEGEANYTRPDFVSVIDALQRERARKGKGSHVPALRLRCLPHGLNLAAQEGLKVKNDVIRKLRDMVIRLRQPRMMEEFRKRLKRKDTGLSQDVRTSWNSTYDMCRDAYNIKTELDEFIHDNNPEFVDAGLSDDDWEVIAASITLMEPFETATRDLSASDVPTIHLGLPGLAQLTEHLDAVENATEYLWVRSSAQAMKKKIGDIADDWKTDAAVVGRLLDPAFKLTELTNPTDADEAREKLQSIFQLYQRAGLGASLPMASTRSFQSKSNTTLSMRDRRLQAASLTSRAVVDEVGEYLVTGVQSDIGILDYWRSREKVYPVLACIARDVLAVQASSVQSERENSKAKLVITSLRNRLNGAAVQASICLKSWRALASVLPDTVECLEL